MRRILTALAFLLCAAMPAAARVIGTVEGSGGSVLLLTDLVGHCINGARVVEWRSPGGKDIIPGCYQIQGQFIFFAFLDGDAGQMPTSAMKPAI